MSTYAIQSSEGTTDSFSPRCDASWNLLGWHHSECSTPIPQEYHGVDEISLPACIAQTAASAKELARIYGITNVGAGSVSSRLARFIFDVVETPVSTFVEPSKTANDIAREPRAYTVFKETAAWLQLTDEELGALVGIGRTTPSSWRREGREPRASTVRKLYELRATLSAVAEAFGEDGLMTWLDSGSPTPREIILQHHWTELNSMIWHALFAPTVKNQPDLSWAPEELEPVTEDEPKAPTPKATRRKLS